MASSTPTPTVRKRTKTQPPTVDLRVPDVVRIAFLDNYLPVLVTPGDFALDFVHVTAKLPREAFARIAVVSVTPFAATIGEVSLLEVDATAYVHELVVVGVGGKVQMLRVAKSNAADEELALSILCALARLGKGVLYAQPRANNGIAVAFEFSTRPGYATPVID